MSLYNLVNGVTPATFFILPMLGKHPDEYPRFRDCFTSDELHPEYDGKIHVYTRVGGGNRNCGYGEEELYKQSGFITTFDDSFDSTFATYVFEVPEKWKPDFDLYHQGKVAGFSKEYQAEIFRVYPKLEEKLRSIWRPTGKPQDET